MKTKLLGVVAASALTFVMMLNAATSSASTIVDQNTSGLITPTIIDFGSGLFGDGTVITNQFQGVVFGPTYAYADSGLSSPPYTSGYLYNPSLSLSEKISFTSDVTAAAFSWRTNVGNTTFEAYLNGSLVESFTASTFPDLLTGHYYGFQGILFNEIRINVATGDPAFNLDNLQLIVTPLPGALPLFATGLGLLGLLGWRRGRKR